MILKIPAFYSFVSTLPTLQKEEVMAGQGQDLWGQQFAVLSVSGL